MSWIVLFHPEFDTQFQAMEEGLQNELLAHAMLLRDFGPNLGRPAVDTLKGSRHANMKELRFAWEGGVWRMAYRVCVRSKAAVDPACGRQQGQCEPEAILQDTYRDSRPEI